MSEKHLYELTIDLAEEWTKNAEKHVKNTIESTLNKRLEELILVLCGFEKEVSRTMYGWKVDHCNNRSGNSPIGQIINEALKDNLELISKNVRLSSDELNKLRAEYKEEYLRSYKREMLNQARKQGENHAKEYSKNTIQSAL